MPKNSMILQPSSPTSKPTLEPGPAQLGKESDWAGIEPACACLWCRRGFQPRQDGGRRQRFCSRVCKDAFHRACRVWAMRAVDDGRLIVVEIKEAPPATYTLVPEAKSASDVLGSQMPLASPRPAQVACRATARSMVPLQYSSAPFPRPLWVLKWDACITMGLGTVTRGDGTRRSCAIHL
jgi:hypothetical protein